MTLPIWLANDLKFAACLVAFLGVALGAEGYFQRPRWLEPVCTAVLAVGGIAAILVIIGSIIWLIAKTFVHP